jgi:fructose-1,6-bisphosphatase/inositol monophosphatase family enzyme
MIAPTEGAKPVDVILEVAGQAPHDMAAGAYIALKAGATVLHLDGKPFRMEDIEEAALHPANEKFRMRYVMAASKALADEAIEWLHAPPL